jgi:hypothetical protein
MTNKNILEILNLNYVSEKCRLTIALHDGFLPESVWTEFAEQTVTRAVNRLINFYPYNCPELREWANNWLAGNVDLAKAHEIWDRLANEEVKKPTNCCEEYMTKHRKDEIEKYLTILSSVFNNVTWKCPNPETSKARNLSWLNGNTFGEGEYKRQVSDLIDILEAVEKAVK